MGQQNSELLNCHEAARMLRTTYAALAMWRSYRTKKLKFVQIGGRVFYRRADVEQFIADSVVEGDSPRKPKKKKKS